MQLIQPHYHAVSRTTWDYQRMAMSGVVAVTEPAFWAGFDRKYPETFIDYFHQLTTAEPARAALHGIKHFSWMAVNPKEAENPTLSREVLSEMPKFFDEPNVLGIGEIGFHKTTPNEELIFEEQVQMAIDYDQMILIHTPHLQDKVRGTKRTLEILKHLGANPDRVCIDHCEEHTVKAPLDAGYWVGFTLYPISKCSPERAIDMLEQFGHERILVNSSADWGPSDPFTVQQAIVEYKARGAQLPDCIDIFHNNPVRFFGQNPKFDIDLLHVSIGEEALV